MKSDLEHLTIGAFAKAAGVNLETIRFYQRKGLLSEPAKPYGSIRRYGQADVTRVRFVKSAQRLGFSLDDGENTDSQYPFHIQIPQGHVDAI